MDQDAQPTTQSKDESHEGHPFAASHLFGTSRLLDEKGARNDPSPGFPDPLASQRHSFFQLDPLAVVVQEMSHSKAYIAWDCGV